MNSSNKEYVKKTVSPSAIQVMRRFLSVNRKHIHILILTIIFSLLTSAMFGLMTQCFRSAIDNFGKAGGIFNIQTILLLLSLTVLIPSQYLQQFLGNKYSEMCDRNMRNKTFAIVSRIDMQALDEQQTGDILSRVNSDLNQINRSLQNYYAVWLPQEIIGIVALVFSLVINWQLTVFSFALVPVIAFIQIKISAPLTRLTRQRQQAAGESLSVANNLMGGYEVAKAFNMSEALQRRYDTAVDKAVDSGIKANRITLLSSPLSQIWYFLLMIVICGFGVYLAGINQITPGGIMAVLILSMFIRNPISDFSIVLSGFKTARGCALRVFELWDMAKESTGGVETQPEADSIIFSDVVFSYHNKPSVLKGLSFEIKKGERVALTGASGSGKSTVIKLLMALYYKNAGGITIFGHPVEEWSTDALRGYISYVGQDSYMFPGTIWDNVAMGGKNPADSQIQAAVNDALLSDIDIHREIGEYGLRLSGGQRQRVAIARAMLKDAPLLLLDEPTSALDTQSEALVSEALQRLMKGRTTIIIAHRLSVLRNIDRILCMENGQIAESGTHRELMSLRGVYCRLYKTQENNNNESRD